MALVSGRSSSLNPNAPLFIPTAFRQVEDFSPKWWELVETSTWFRDYWLSQHKEDDFGESANDTTNDDIANLPQELCDLFIDDDFDCLENEFEQLVLSSEAQEFAAHADSNNGEQVVDVLLSCLVAMCEELTGSNRENSFLQIQGVPKDAKAILKQLTVPKSPKERGPKSPAALAKCHEKPAQHVNLKCAPRRIHQIQQPR